MTRASTSTDWFARESFWRDFYPSMFPPERFATAEADMVRLLDLVRPAGRRALDLCCGPGRYTRALADQGFQVTGVDRSRFLLGKARAHLKGCTPVPELVREDMREFQRAGEFDLAINLFTSFGYFADPADDLRVLRNVLASLRPGGVLVMEMMGKERLAAVFQPGSVSELADGTLMVERRAIVADWTRIRNEWILIQGETVRRHTFEHTVFSGRELRDLLLAAGFARVELHGDLDGSPYDRRALRLLAVARKA